MSWLQLGMEQNVNIPVPGRGERNAGLQGFLPEQSSFNSAACFSGTHFGADCGADRWFPRWWRRQDCRPGQSSSSSSHVPAGVHEALDEPGEYVFSHFSPK